MGYALPKLLEELPQDGPTCRSSWTTFTSQRPGAQQHYRGLPALSAGTRPAGDLDPIGPCLRDGAPESLGQAWWRYGRASSGSTTERSRRSPGDGGQGLPDEGETLWPTHRRLAGSAPPAGAVHPGPGPGPLLRAAATVNRPVVDYLASDVLELLGPEVREFVLRASVLGRMNAALCDAVVAITGSGAILAELERSNLFMSVDDTGEWYQLHHLFAEVLRLELARTRPELVPGLHLRAARWFEDAGELETATAHAITSRDLDVATRLVALQASQFAAGGAGRPSAVGCRSCRGRRRRRTQSSPSSEQRRPASSTTWTSQGSGSTSRPPVLPASSAQWGCRSATAPTSSGHSSASTTSTRRKRRRAGRSSQRRAAVGGGRLRRPRPGRVPARTVRRARDTLLKAVGLIPDANPNLLALAIGNLALAEYADGSPSHAAAMLDDGAELIRTSARSGRHRAGSCIWRVVSVHGPVVIRGPHSRGSSRPPTCSPGHAQCLAGQHPSAPGAGLPQPR